ncbi:hypothetical protein F2Q69_00033631 [Brassica cretica]|uniref:Uncharacterized protein n=1 Tax=Brassica cretica TaxID=69181 RepID=A0A8S9SUJ1_BRACR|nr:hypothetical protein F2Q69_00033631 [Brassica cretica]
MVALESRDSKRLVSYDRLNERPFIKQIGKGDSRLPSAGISGELVDLSSGRGGGGGTISYVSDGSISVELQRLGFLRNKIMGNNGLY